MHLRAHPMLGCQEKPFRQFGDVGASYSVKVWGSSILKSIWKKFLFFQKNDTTLVLRKCPKAIYTRCIF